MTTEHRGFPSIPNTTVFPAQQPGPQITPLLVVAALTSSTNYPRSRITLCSVLGSIGLTAHQAATLRDQLDQAVAAVVAACPEMSVPDEIEQLPKVVARG
jgi:hypothetical protein